MAQNVYDTPSFFVEYQKLARSQHGLDGAPEWPTLRNLVGDVRDARVLDLGCGFGWFCRWAIKHGSARAAHGIDLSENMLARAQAMTPDAEFPGISYQRADLEGLRLPTRAYDLVYSSLVLHYLPTPSLRNLLAEVFTCLIHGGRFVFSIEHPVLTAPADASWKRDENGTVYWPLNQYWDEGLRVTDWLAPGVRKYHRTVETYLSLLLSTGFELTAYKESWDGLDLKPRLEDTGEAHRPYFLFIAVRKPPAE
ncbi:uncharacterized protein PV07_01525 [Cladophialophora immunda]|uniref:Methyltransferase domain-containing protein n=1 Tax=Cladophialophora immunda TaxID=569365 RepID=A0A0D2CUE3_9EURO|nr:uncharacterized protein PV07_01525 [Cladophialophora immunda]KIW34768.1 hypothetical protein PV07_01525 [Cladophialophora immunda]OQV08727.1 Methyltransferase domain-containing protein [Cladophialophora immunda]